MAMGSNSENEEKMYLNLSNMPPRHLDTMAKNIQKINEELKKEMSGLKRMMDEEHKAAGDKKSGEAKRVKLGEHSNIAASSSCSSSNKTEKKMAQQPNREKKDDDVEFVDEIQVVENFKKKETAKEHDGYSSRGTSPLTDFDVSQKVQSMRQQNEHELGMGSSSTINTGGEGVLLPNLVTSSSNAQSSSGNFKDKKASSKIFNLTKHVVKGTPRIYEPENTEKFILRRLQEMNASSSMSSANQMVGDVATNKYYPYNPVVNLSTMTATADPKAAKTATQQQSSSSYATKKSGGKKKTSQDTIAATATKSTTALADMLGCMPIDLVSLVNHINDPTTEFAALSEMTPNQLIQRKFELQLSTAQVDKALSHTLLKRIDAEKKDE